MDTCVTPTLAWAAALTLMLPFPVTGPPAGEVICTVGGLVSFTGAGAVTVTVRLAVPVLPAGSCAATDSAWVPATVPAFQPNAKEALVVELTSTPSQYNLKLLMPRLRAAAPLPVPVPETVLPAVGAEIPTEGGGLTGAESAALTALYAFTRPHPKLGSKPVAPRSSAFASSSDTSALAEREGRAASASAPTPAAIGEEKEVPYHVPYPPPLVVVRMLLPGAERSIQEPKFEKLASVSVGSVALTATTLSQAAG